MTNHNIRISSEGPREAAPGMVGAFSGTVPAGANYIEVNLENADPAQLGNLLGEAADAYVRAFVPQGILTEFTGDADEAPTGDVAAEWQPKQTLVERIVANLAGVGLEQAEMDGIVTAAQQARNRLADLEESDALQSDIVTLRQSTEAWRTITEHPIFAGVIDDIRHDESYLQAAMRRLDKFAGADRSETNAEHAGDLDEL